MAENGRDQRAHASEADIEAYTVGGARRHDGPVHLAEFDPTWSDLFECEAARIEAALGQSGLRIEHVGSTSVPGLAAKPIIDIVLEVADSADESSYIPSLEAAGYTLRVREPDWFEHRMFKGPDTDVNLHVFTAGCPEVERMVRFRDHLRTNSVDRKLYEDKKRQLASRDWAYIQNYADAKTDVIQEINARVSTN